jgi:hypothetical protein
VKKQVFLLSAAIVLLSAISSFGQAEFVGPHLKFDMVRSAAARNGGDNCAPNVSGKVTITPKDGVERLSVEVAGLPPNTNFDFFVIQVPNSPFGMAWYQGDLTTDDEGNGSQTFLGRFNSETFVVAQGSAAAPVLHTNPPFPDAATNPATEPVHMFHLGLWFDSPAGAVAAGCPNTATRFNGDHDAGIQVLSTRNFTDKGPLSLLVQ